jgi:signal transduction histidine kinase/ActR/RegA family two-component response regulator
MHLNHDDLTRVIDELKAENAALKRARDLSASLIESGRKQAKEALRAGAEDLRHKRSAEVIGRLAGGVAHEFNNLLTTIVGYSNLLLETLEGNEEALEQVRAIRDAGDRAALLTRQLLAFGRRQVLHPELLDLNGIAANFESTLRDLAGEQLELVVDCEPDLWQVRADPDEIDRAIMNLFLNAKDAMPGTGTVTVQTANLTLTDGEARAQGLHPGRYAMLAVRDTGSGMDAETQARIFEPFFPAPGLGHNGSGAGLGLAAVWGFAEQSGGTVRCASEPGQGTIFRIMLPAVYGRPDNGAPAAGPSAESQDGPTILLVDDEDSIRGLVRRILEAEGYVILEARNGREALALCEDRRGPIDLLLTDVLMPELGGRELASGALKLRPEMGVLFMSGYAPEMILDQGAGNGASFLQKPYTPTELKRKVREAIEAEAIEASAVVHPAAG